MEIRFDHVLKRTIDAHNRLVNRTYLIQKHWKLWRKDAFEFAEGVLMLQSQCTNQFLDWVHSNSVDLDRWMDDHFTPIEAMGENRKSLFKAIEDGMTKDEYVEKGLLLWLHSARKKSKTVENQQAARTGLVRDAPPDSMTLEERCQWQARQIDALQAEVRRLDKENKEHRRDKEKMARQISQLNKLMKRDAA